MYYLNYIQKLREDSLHSPLFFGNALDKALTALLEAKKEGTQIDPYPIFDKNFIGTYLNEIYVSIPFFDRVKYNKADFEPKLLTEDDYKAINLAFDSLLEVTPDNIIIFIEEVRELLKQENHELSNDEIILFIRLPVQF